MSKVDTSGKARRPRPVERPRSARLFIHPRRWGWLFLFGAVLLYANTLAHEYVLDDGIVILENRYTTQGAAGIPALFSQDSFAGWQNEEHLLAGGRYRPLSLVTFALEWEMFGRSPAVSHAINIILYGLTVALLYGMTRRLTGGNTLVAALTTVLFTVHPTHTEVVANIKGRDDLLVVLFFVWSFDLLMRWVDRPSTMAAAGRTAYPGQAAWPGRAGGRGSVLLGGSLLVFVLALFSKETALCFPVLYAAGLWCGRRIGAREILRLIVPFLVLASLFALLRASITAGDVSGGELLNDPYLGTAGAAKVATILAILARYLGLFLWPAILSHDYSPWQIPIHDWGQPAVWWAALLLAGLVSLTILGLRRHRLYGFGLLIHLAGVMLVSNLVINIGAPMADRFLYLPSLGLSLVLGTLAATLITRERSHRFGPVAVPTLVGALLTLVVVTASARTVIRNQDWKNDATLFLADVGNAPGSAKTNKAAAGVLIQRAATISDPLERRSGLREAMVHLERAIEIYPDYADAYLDLGMARRLNGQTAMAEPAWTRYLELRPESALRPQLERYLADSYAAEGRALLGTGNDGEAAQRFRSALDHHPDDPELWYSFGVSQLSRDPAAAARALEQSLKLAPEHREARRALEELSHRPAEAAEAPPPEAPSR